MPSRIKLLNITSRNGYISVWESSAVVDGAEYTLRRTLELLPVDFRLFERGATLFSCVQTCVTEEMDDL